MIGTKGIGSWLGSEPPLISLFAHDRREHVRASSCSSKPLTRQIITKSYTPLRGEWGMLRLAQMCSKHHLFALNPSFEAPSKIRNLPDGYIAVGGWEIFSSADTRDTFKTCA